MHPARCTPVEGVHAGHQFGGFEWLAKVIIGPGVEPFGAVAGAPECAQHQDRCVYPALAQAGQDLEAVVIAQHSIEYDDIELVLPR